MAIRWLVAASIAQGGVGAISSEMQAVLDKHNVYRCMHGVPAFTWDDDIAANAQAWADGGTWGHSSSSSRKVNGQTLGENLAWGYPSRSGAASTTAWYKEIEFTSPYGTADSSSDVTVQGEPIGHYTQVVWSTSLKLGCGKGRAEVRGKDGDYWVCQYGPAGNYRGQYTEKVKAPVKTAEQCGGTSADVPANAPAPGTADSGETSSTSTKAPAGAVLPSSCKPSEPLPHGALCAYGYQCASQFCCPRLRVCLTSPSTGVSSNDIKVKDGMKSTIVGLIFSGGTCTQAFSNSRQCMQTSSGQPLSTWNQEVCGCKDEYMTRYRAGTWVTLNDIPGLVCAEETTTTAGGGGATTTSLRGTAATATEATPLENETTTLSGAPGRGGRGDCALHRAALAALAGAAAATALAAP